MRRVFGRDLKVGDTIDVWWGHGRDTITDLRPYDGLPDVFTEGARIAIFAHFTTGMTIENDEHFDLIARSGGTGRDAT